MTAVLPTDIQAAEKLATLPERFAKLPGFGEVVAAMSRQQTATIDGVWGSSCALLAAALASADRSPLIVVLPTQREADDLSIDLALFRKLPILPLPSFESAIVDELARDDAFGPRLRTLKELHVAATSPATTATPQQLVVTCVQALLQPMPERDLLAKSSKRLKKGDSLEIDALLRWLVEHGYESTTSVQLPGEFCHRGGIIDLFAHDWQRPARLELFDDEIESIRQFDVATQRSLGTLDWTEITAIPTSANAGGALADYLPKNSRILLIAPDRLSEEGRSLQARSSAEAKLSSVSEVLSSLSSFGIATADEIAAGSLGVPWHMPIESVEQFSGDLSKVRDQLDELAGDHEVLVLTPTEAEVQRLREIFATTKLAAAGRLSYVTGTLREGFRVPSDKLIIITGGELFHRGELRRLPRRRLGKAIDSFLDLREGDLVVHLAHGIGRFAGIKLLERGETSEEHLEIEFDGGTRIYVPAVRIDLVQKYIGGTKNRPALAKIGGKTWLKQKKAAESAVADLAVEMLELQAVRSARPGIAFSADSEWQKEFDNSFPFQETPDQLTSIASIKSDMQRARPMDRLLCGDVGYGKTEVAMRAAFKAVDNGYQVAVLVPTTILAEQHYRSFVERMAEFPFDIAKLSRFCTPQEERESLKGIKSGKVDIVVGTHRLASQDVEFHNLGLVIIDEEQRFGVDVKERLKALRSTVDVLTLSATPIPRTLHMSLVGVRDISNLESPPEDRVPVETAVKRWNNDLIRTAILRELNRGGQIYFVHNRVNDIEIIARRLNQIVPEASLRIGHGQMNETELESVMVDFVAGKFDLLLATTIVESGLDIPNANTIFINEAERYGLADLHQLRGRVGRYKNRAHCYLLIDSNKSITPNAARRLRAIEEFSQMGAGFQISMRDLEIRGAGNLLGTQQSGHIAAVGYELYCQLLENAVRSLQRQPPKQQLAVDLNLPGEAYLPTEYVDDMRLKIDLYRRLSRVGSPTELSDFRGELVDRFGEPPAPVEHLLLLTGLKIDAMLWGIVSIYLEDQFVVLRGEAPVRLAQLAKTHKGRVRLVDERHCYLPLPQKVIPTAQLYRLIKSVLQPAK